MMLDLDRLDFAKDGGVVTVVAQDATTGAVLMVAYADRDALERTMSTGEMHYRSRTRGLWHKGATSGHTQRVVSLTPDCDGDAVLARVVPNGPACHTGAPCCFDASDGGGDALSALDAVITRRASGAIARARERAGDGDTATSVAGHDQPRSSYTVRLLEDRNLRLKKLGEEAAELVVACADGDSRRATEEMADLVYHALVALHAAGSTLTDVQHALAERARRSRE